MKLVLSVDAGQIRGKRICFGWIRGWLQDDGTTIIQYQDSRDADYYANANANAGNTIMNRHTQPDGTTVIVYGAPHA